MNKNKEVISKKESERPSEAEIAPEGQGADQEAVAFVERHRDFFENYARGEVTFKPAPEGLDTFAFDLENDAIYISPRFYEERGLSEERTSFATLHELEHFLEKKELLAEGGGAHKFRRYLEKIKKSQAYGLMDNCVAAVRENRAVVGRTSESMQELEQGMYREDLFPTTDLTGDPRHTQFAQALLREQRVPEEECGVAPEVREKLDELYNLKTKTGKRALDIFTDPDVPMSKRLAFQDGVIWPVVEELLEKDMEDERNKQNKQGESSEGGDQGGSHSESEQADRSEGEESRDEDGNEQRDSSAGPQNDSHPERNEGSRGEGEVPDPNEVFKEAYERASKRVPQAVPVEEQERAFEKWKAQNPLDRADKEYAQKIGVDKRDLQRYRQLASSLEQIKNPETNESVIEELRNIIRRIIAKRLKPSIAPRYPTEEGEELVDPAELVAQVKAGNLEPKVWESAEIKEKKDKKFGEIEITLVCDRSGSMNQSGKLQEQQKAAVLMMEALKEFADLADEKRADMEAPLEVRSEVYAFQASAEDKKPLKPMAKELTEKQRIEVAKKLSSAPGSKTTDNTPLEAMVAGMTREEREQIKEGELKKVAIVFTDGGSDYEDEVKVALKKLRNDGVRVFGVGITKAGEPALTLYAPDARLAKRAQDLPIVLGDLLKGELQEL